MSEVTFSVLVNNVVALVRGTREKKFYRMRNPVPVGDLDNMESLVQACTVEDNRILFDPGQTNVGELAEDFSVDHIYVHAFVDTPGGRALRFWFESAKFGKHAPSSMDFKCYKSLQEDSRERLFDHRAIGGTRLTHPDDQVPPIPLLYLPFGTFVDTYLGIRSNTTSAPLSLKIQVEDFADQMSQIYSSEDKRRDVALNHLNIIFHEVLNAGLLPIRATAFGSYKTDGHFLGPRGTPIFITQVKNEMSGISSIPIVELCGYYHKLVTEVDEDLRSFSRMPALGLTVVGPLITFYAIAFVGRVHYTALTSTISCVWGAVNGYDRQNLYKAFVAAVDLLRCIVQDVHSTEPLSRLTNHLYPAITELPSLETGHPIQFKIIRPFVPTDKGRYIYLATCTSNNSPLIVKFTRGNYSVDLHAHCAREGRAPRLLGYAKFPGNISGIAMDLVDEPEALNVKEGSLDDRKNWANQLTQLVESFHAAGYVHGELRCPNVLVTNDRVMLIDFDWGGKEREAFYPLGRLNAQLTEGRQRSDLMITKEDDKRILAITLREIGVDSLLL